MNQRHCSTKPNCPLGKFSLATEGCSCDCSVCLGLDDIDEYLDDEPIRKPKTGKDLRKFRQPTG